MALIKVMRRKDAPHVILAASAAMRKRTDVLEEVWLDTETRETTLELPKATESENSPPKDVARKSKSRRQPRKVVARKAPEVDADLLSQAQAALED